MHQIICVSGTNRPDNYTSRALEVVIDELGQKGVKTVVFDACDLTLAFPGHPATEDGERLREAIEEAAGVILATPEYHGTFCAMTKLIIENLGFPSALSGKPMALMGVAAGRIWAIKSLEQLKGVCSHIGAIVVPGSVSIAGVQNVFDDNGQCTDSGSEAALRNLANALLNFLKEYVCPKHTLEEMVRSGAAPWTTSV